MRRKYNLSEFALGGDPTNSADWGISPTLEMGEGGGYVVGAVHNIQPDVPVENILAMFQHAREYVPSYLRG